MGPTVGMAWCIGLVLASAPAVASRYAEVRADVLSAEQQAPLRVSVTLEFPRSAVRTVGDAVRVALARSGYALASGPRAQAAMAPLLAMPLPDVHRRFEGAELATVLVALGSPAWRLAIDDAHRLVAFELAPEYVR